MSEYVKRLENLTTALGKSLEQHASQVPSTAGKIGVAAEAVLAATTWAIRGLKGKLALSAVKSIEELFRNYPYPEVIYACGKEMARCLRTLVGEVQFKPERIVALRKRVKSLIEMQADDDGLLRAVKRAKPDEEEGLADAMHSVYGMLWTVFAISHFLVYVGLKEEGKDD